MPTSPSQFSPASSTSFSTTVSPATSGTDTTASTAVLSQAKDSQDKTEPSYVVGSGASMATPLLTAYHENLEEKKNSMTQAIVQAIQNISATAHLPRPSSRVGQTIRAIEDTGATSNQGSSWEEPVRALIEKTHCWDSPKNYERALAQLQKIHGEGRKILGSEAFDGFAGILMADDIDVSSSDQSLAEKLDESDAWIAATKVAAKKLEGKVQTVKDQLNEITNAIRMTSVGFTHPALHGTVSRRAKACISSSETLDNALTYLQKSTREPKDETQEVVDKFTGFLILESPKKLSNEDWSRQLGGLEPGRIPALKIAGNRLKENFSLKSLTDALSNIKDTIFRISVSMDSTRFARRISTFCLMVKIARIYSACHRAVYRSGHDAIRAPGSL